jgi:hypothetical protein
MDPLHLSVELFPREPSIEVFLKHWSGGYNDASRDKSLYEPNIVKKLELERDAIWPLFEWKNGSPLSMAKREVVRINYIEPWEAEESLEPRYLNPRAPGHRAIWNIFYLHCRRPDIYPIYDQHTYRAMHYIKTREIAEIPKPQHRVYATYADYREFVEALRSALPRHNRQHSIRLIDQALFAFGKFLKLAEPYALPSSRAADFRGGRTSVGRVFGTAPEGDVAA